MKRLLCRATESTAYPARKKHQVTRISSGNQQRQSNSVPAGTSQASDSLIAFRPSSPRTVLSADSVTLSRGSTSVTIESNTESSVLQPELEVTSPAFGADKGCSVEEFTDLSLREEEGDCSDPARDYTERQMVFSEGTAGVTVSKRARNERDGEGMWKVAKRRCVAFDCVTIPHLPSLGEPRIQPDARKTDAHTSSPASEPTSRSTTSKSPSPVSRPQAIPLTSPQPCPTASDLPVLSCPLTRFKRQRPPTIDIPRKGCFTSSPAGTPDSAAEDALDGVVEVAESGACFAVACKRGRKAVMEDTYQALMGFAGRESDAFFGVFDGHGGTAAAKFAASELASHVAQAAARRGAHASAAAVVEGYLETDRRFLGQNVASGTSCLTCWATPGRLLLAHAGDCKAVLVKGGRAVELTEDHRAGREDEQARITALGGFVDTATGMPRVQGILAVTRGIGDAHLKAFITPQPDVAQVRVGADCSALILASDGLWDVVAPQEGADVVMACVGTALEARAAAGEAKAAEREVGSAASALLGPPASPPCKRARMQHTQGWSVEPRQEREKERGEWVRERECRNPFSSPLGTPPCTPRSHTTAITPPCTPHSRASTTPPCLPRPRIPSSATNTTTASAVTTATTTPPTPRRLFSPGSIARPPFTPPWLDTPCEPSVRVGPNSAAAGTSEEVVATERPANLATLQQASAAVLADERESESGGSKKVEGAFRSEKGIRDCSGGGGSERGGSERETREVDGEVLLSACQALVGMAAARGSRDDITVMLVSLAPFAESAAS